MILTLYLSAPKFAGYGLINNTTKSYNREKEPFFRMGSDFN